MDNNKLGIACDHAGYELKEFLVGYLGSKGYDVYDFGTNSPESVDYPDYAHPLATNAASTKFRFAPAPHLSNSGADLLRIRVPTHLYPRSCTPCIRIPCPAKVHPPYATA